MTNDQDNSSSKGESWFARGVANDYKAARRMAWRRHPKRMLRNIMRPQRRPPPVPDMPASNAEILARLKDLPIGFWTYGWEDPSVHHLGPMAQDFWHAFGLGGTDRQIPTIDGQGVLIASVKALLERVEQLETEVAALTNNNDRGD